MGAGAQTRRADPLPLAVGAWLRLTFFVTHFLSDDGARAWVVVVKPGLNRREAGLGPKGGRGGAVVVKPAFRRREAGRGRVGAVLGSSFFVLGSWLVVGKRNLASGMR
jgi:hypothetical protein